MRQSVFYLDDDAGCLAMFQQTFSGEYDMRTATTPAEARRLLSERSADIIISDQSLPGARGTEFLGEVAVRYPESCRMLLADGVLIGDVIREIGDGIVHCFVPKPWTEQNMRHALERASVSFGLYSTMLQMQMGKRGERPGVTTTRC